MKKMFIVLLLAIFLIGSVSALEIDNVKSYDPVSKTATFENFFGLGSEIATIRLDTPTYYKVPVGYQKVAQFTTTGNVDYKDFIDQIDFYDVNQGLKHFNRDFDLKKLTYENVEVDDYTTNCDLQTSVNGTTGEICKEVITGSHLEKREKWVKLTPADLKKDETLTIGVFTNVEMGDHVEWIPEFFGVKVPEWASWTQSLEVDLDLFYQFDESSGTTVSDFQGNYTGTSVNTEDADWTNGVILNSMNLDGTDEYINTTYNPVWTATDNYTVSLWFNTNASAISTSMFGSGDSCPTGDEFRVQSNTGAGNGWRLRVLDGSSTTNYDIGVDLSTGVWKHIVFVSNKAEDKLRIYVDGVSVSNATDGQTATIDLSACPIYIGADDDGSGTPLRFSASQYDLFGIWNRPLTQEEVTDLYNGGAGITPALPDASPIVTEQSPENNTEYTTSPIVVNFTAYGSDDQNFTEMQFYFGGSLNQTNATGLNDTNYTFALTLSDGEYNWSFKGYDNNSQSTTTDLEFLTIDSTDPVLSVAYNLSDIVTFSLPTNSTWHFNATDPHLDSCYYNTSIDPTLQVITCNSTQTTNWTTAGSKTIQFCANDTLGHETCNTTTINIYSISYEQFDNPDPVAEGFDVTFNLTVNMSSIPTTTANLTINDTIYKPTTIQAGSDGYYFEVTVEMPYGWGNTTGFDQGWFWNYTIDGVTSNRGTSNETVTVYSLGIDDCSVYGEVILNLSLNDEETDTYVNETAGSNVEIDLLLTSKTNSSIYLAYNNTWADDNNPVVCIPSGVLNNSQYWIDFTIGFDSTDHVWEFYYLDDGTLNSTKVFDGQTDYEISLMDLLTADSTSFLFNYFDQDGLPVDDAIIHVFRKYIGIGKFLEVERSKADQNGDTIVHLVEEDVIYYFVISQYGIPLYTSSTYTALCQATPCTIQIEASGGFATFPTDYDLIDGGAVAINSSASSRQVSLTYSLNHTADMNLTVYKYNSDGSYSPINSSEQTGSSGVITLSVPQSAGNVSFFASISKDDQFIKSEWVDFEGKATDRFGLTLSLFIGALIILTLGLVAVTEGAGTIVMVILGVFLSGALGLITTNLSTGVNVLIYLILAGGLILWKVTSRRGG